MLKVKAPNWDQKRFKELGRGGEAVVYKLKPDTVAKVFLQPTAPEFADNKELQKAARVRIEEMQHKLFAVPKDLPSQVVVPTGVMMDERRQVFGYIMPFVHGVSLDRLTRTDSRLKYEQIGKLLTNLHDIVRALHAKDVVIGDFNENNIIVRNLVPHLIDVDSMQFGSYQCRSFFLRFVAPELVEIEGQKAKATESPKKMEKYIPPWDRDFDKEFGHRHPRAASKEKDPVVLKMVQPHSKLTDWYSFLVIAMRLFTHTEPFGGVLKGMPLAERVTKNITVFNPKVVYPLNARPLREVPRPILELFFRVFAKNERLVPDRALFENLKTPVGLAPHRKNKQQLQHRKQKEIEYEDDGIF